MLVLVSFDFSLIFLEVDQVVEPDLIKEDRDEATPHGSLDTVRPFTPASENRVGTQAATSQG